MTDINIRRRVFEMLDHAISDGATEFVNTEKVECLAAVLMDNDERLTDAVAVETAVQEFRCLMF